ncbi:aldo/keto reductase [Streptosporangium canum]|uniref:aldo/keto reductase n=1 Tax=Streptosporangium canum TaxID=324952 RepID=UPI0033B63696
MPAQGLDHAAAEGPLAWVAKEVGATPVQVVLTWLLARSPVMPPIPGTGSAAHLEENMAAARIELTREQFSRLDAVGRETRHTGPARRPAPDRRGEDAPRDPRCRGRRSRASLRVADKERKPVLADRPLTTT